MGKQNRANKTAHHLVFGFVFSGLFFVMQHKLIFILLKYKMLIYLYLMNGGAECIFLKIVYLG